MNTFDVEARIDLNDDEYIGGLKNASKETQSFGSKLKTGLKTAAKVGAAAVTAASTAAVAFGATSVKAGAEFDKAMSQVAATSGKTVEEIQNLRDFAQQMGSTTAFSATQAAEALNYMALAGYDAETSMEMLPNVLNLAAAGGIDLAYASDMVTDASSALGLSLDETSTMVDQMAKASSKTNTSVSQLGEAILTIGATARSISGGTTELSTILGALADNGIKGAEGGTHLRNMILSLQSPTDEAANTLNKLGIAVYDADGNMRSMIDIIGDLQTSVDGMDAASKDAIVSGIFNKTDLAAVNALLNTSQERFAELTTAIENADGAAKAMADTQLDNLAGDITLFKSALEGAQIAISDQLTPSLRKFVKFGTEGISNLTTAFQEGGLSGAMEAFGQILSDGLSMAVEGLPGAVDAGMKLLEALGKGIADNLDIIIDSAVKVIKMLSTGLLDHLPDVIDAGLDLIFGLIDGMIDIIPDLIPKLVDAVIKIADKIIDHIDEFVDAGIELFMAVLDGIMEALPIIIDKLPEIILKLIDAIVENVPVLIDAIVNALPELIDGMIQLVMGLVEALPVIIQALVDALPTIITSIVNGLLACLPQLIQGAITLVIELVKHLPEIIMALIQAIPAIIQAIIEAFAPLATDLGNKASEAIDAIIEWFKKLPEKLAYWAGEAIGAFLAFFRDLPKNIKEWFDKTIEKTKDFGKEFAKLALDKAKEFKDNLIDGIKNLPDRIKDIGRNIVDGLKNGIKEKWDAMVDWFNGLGENLIAGFQKTFGISSPSKVFAKLGSYMVQGLEVGWDDEFDNFQKDVGSVKLDMDVSGDTTTAIRNDNDSEIADLLRAILNHMPDGIDPNSIFRLVRTQNEEFKATTGESAFT